MLGVGDGDLRAAADLDRDISIGAQRDPATTPRIAGDVALAGLRKVANDAERTDDSDAHDKRQTNRQCGQPATSDIHDVSSALEITKDGEHTAMVGVGR